MLNIIRRCRFNVYLIIIIIANCNILISFYKMHSKKGKKITKHISRIFIFKFIIVFVETESLVLKSYKRTLSLATPRQSPQFIYQWLSGSNSEISNRSNR